MRPMLIDTDTGSDDAVALLMALLSDEVSVEAITTVAGNTTLPQATLNALASIEISGRPAPPVYPGAAKPLMRPLVTAENVHGQDGMGDAGLIHPTLTPETGHAVDCILDLAKKYPGQLEIVTLGPLTNLAQAIVKDPAAMAGVKSIVTMGTGGFGPGNVTPAAEFNIFVDAEAFAILLQSGIPLTLAGYDLCTSDTSLQQPDIEHLLTKGSPAGKFAVNCNKTLLKYNLKTSGNYEIDLPDPIAMAAALWEDTIQASTPCYCYTCTKEEATYGQVLLYTGKDLGFIPPYNGQKPNARVITKFNHQLFKERLLALLTA